MIVESGCLEIKMCARYWPPVHCILQMAEIRHCGQCSSACNSGRMNEEACKHSKIAKNWGGWAPVKILVFRSREGKKAGTVVLMTLPFCIMSRWPAGVAKNGTFSCMKLQGWNVSAGVPLQEVKLVNYYILCILQLQLLYNHCTNSYFSGLWFDKKVKQKVGGGVGDIVRGREKLFSAPLR